MKIKFNMHSDGSLWNYLPASVGEIRTGPLGLLGVMETRLGLSGETVNPAVRIDEYMKRMEQADCTDIWYHKSFETDPWSTAKQMLQWRDELVTAGWNGDEFKDPSERLNALYLIEKSSLPLSKGVSDRIREVNQRLGAAEEIYISSIQIEDDFSLLPPVWQDIFAKLEKIGVRIHRNTFKTNEDIYKQDDSFVLVESSDEWEAAENLALWLSSDKEGNKDVSIICGMDTSILDQSLMNHGLPRLGRLEPSKWREIQQVMPLFLANAWLPVDIKQIVQLLSLTTAPFPQWVCNKLLNAIGKEPGVGGRAWENALKEIEDKRFIELTEKNDPKALENAKKYVDELNSFLVKNRYDPKTGIPEEEIRARCQKITRWFSWQLETDENVREIVGQAGDLQKLSSGKGKIPKITLERMLDTVIGEGSSVKGCQEQVSNWKTADRPGQISESSEILIWWGFNDTQGSMETYWSPKEVSSLKSSDIYPDLSPNKRKREENSWMNAISYAKKKFIGIYIKNIDGEESFHHPLWDTILQKLRKTHPDLSQEQIKFRFVKGFNRFNEIVWKFQGREKYLTPVEKILFEEIFPKAQIASGIIPYPEKLSYSQISTLAGCPMKWALEYHAKIRVSDRQSIPEGNQMIGNLCHRIVEEIYKDPDSQPDSEKGRKIAGEMFDLLVPSMASELLLEGKSIEHMRYREGIVQAIGSLVELINKLSLKVVATEEELTAEIDGLKFLGYADLILKDKKSHTYLLDLKWSSSSKYREKEISEGSCLQLATYAWMLKTKNPHTPVHAGYFMLAQGKIVTPDLAIDKNPIESSRTLEEIWNLGRNSFKETMEEILSGNIRAKGVEEYLTEINDGIKREKLKDALKFEHASKQLLYMDPPCTFCDFSSFCGLPGGVR